jgi:hypothetical protein
MHVIQSKASKWRYRCPQEHTNWYPIDGKFRCRTCASDRDRDPEYRALVDTKTDERVPREEIELDVHRGGQVHG